MNTDTSYTSITSRLKQHKRTRDGPSPGCMDVSQFVPERPLPDWIRHRRVKGTRTGPESATAVPLALEGNRGGDVKKLDPSSTTSATMMLDLNNMRKDWKSVSTRRIETVQRARIAHNRQAEPVRRFPGEVRQSSTPSDSPVALFAKSCNVGKTRRKFDSPTAVEGLDLGDGFADEGKEEAVSPLLMKNTFLTLDQSKLPLEIFDGVEDTDEHGVRKSWIESGSDAMAPFYVGDEWQWRRCSVLSFDSTTNKYRVKFLHNGLEKEVKRFNLLFDAENRDAWQSCRDAAKSSREDAKKRLRFDYFVSQQRMEEVRAVQGSTIRGIHEKVADGLPLDVEFPQQGTKLGNLLRDLTKQVIQHHTRSMKKSILFYKLKHSQVEKERYFHLGLPAVPEASPIPWSAKVNIPPHPYSERRKALGNIHYSSLSEVLQAFLWLYEVWEAAFLEERFMDTELKSLDLPCNIDDFCKIQSKCCARLEERLAQDWRRASAEQLVDSVQDIYDFFQSESRLFASSSLFRLLKHFELRMNSQLRTLFTESLLAWRRFVEKHTPDSAEINIEAAGSAPLFDVRLKVVTADGGNICVSIVPGLPQIEDALMRIVDDMVAAVKGFGTIDVDLMSLLHLSPRSIFDIGAGDGTYAEVESVLDETRRYTRERVTRGMEGAERLGTKYGKYCHLMAIDTEEFVYSFTEVAPAPTDAEYFAKVRELHEASVAIGECSLTCELFKLVRVDTSEATNVLKAKALEVRDALLESLVSKAREQNNDIISRYEAILSRIAEKPANEADLAALRVFIADSKEKVASLILEVQRVHARLGTLSDFNYRMSEGDIRLSWRTMDYPTMVDRAASKAEEALELDKVRMMDKLALEMETFEEILERFEVDVAHAKQCDDYSQMETTTDYVNSIQDAINDAKTKAEDFNSREKVFGFPPTEYHVLGKVEEELEPFYKLWNMISDFQASRKEWLHGSFLDLNGADIERDVTDWWKSSYRLSKSLEDEFPAAAKCAAQLREDTTAFREHLPVIQALASPALKSRHWETLSEKTGSTIEPDEELTLQQLVDTNVGQHIETIHEVCVAAEKEYGLEKALAAMKDEWASLEFEVRPYKETGTFLVSGVDEIVTLLDDHIVKTQTMRGSPYILPIETECKAWEFRLKYAQGLVDEWINCQRTWLYLEPIFSSEDIMRQLPTEARRFNSVDQLWKKTMEETNKDPNFMAQADVDKKLEEKFKAANQKLEEIQKGLSDYLEMKRLYFPRFFFLSNDELLEILSQTKEPRAVQPHLNKAFEGIAKCKFEEDLKITEMVSAEGETVVLDRAVDPESAANKGNVERWLLELEAMQWESVRTQVTLSLKEYPTISREQWVLNWPAQAVLGVSQVFWTQDVATSIKTGGVKGLNETVQTLNQQLRNITLLVRGRLSSLERKTLGALCTIDVHARDTVVKMIEAGVSHEDDFDWMSQLRYYWVEAWKDGQAVKKGDNTLVARIVNAKCLYGYEYLGNTMRLVITPLTDRCYRTMIGAIDLLYGGAPEGPAGTGKTETVKDLSKAVAIQCVVFNCSDGLDYLAMAKFFKGLAGCGSWCCFDEFNRINIEVLSVIAQQILTINKAKKACVEKFHFEGTFMKINSNANAFITMNPGYAGRAELPDNLKALFRPCAMMVPDYSLISEIRLYSFGFEDARQNAQKLVRVLQLCSEQLSSQKHYDYGMRAVNSILVAAGNLRQALGDDPNWTEARLVLRSVNDINLPKFTVEDLPLFKGITSDLFPGVELGESDHGPLLQNIDTVCEEGITISSGQALKLVPLASWRKKVIQLYEMVLVRHGVMIVGQTGSGKTTTVHTLAHAMSRCCEDGSTDFARVQVHTMNPKSISSGQLYGNFDDSTHEWSDGILAVIYRNCSKDTSPDRKWLMFDGPVDAVWIENMNTVLDDNKKLCLMSGEIVKMSDTMTMMFEAEDLEQASPATVSRVGMIFCEIRNLDWQPLRDVWLTSLPVTFEEHRPLIVGLFDWLFPAALYFVQKQCVIPTPVTGQELAASLIRLVGVLLDSPDGFASDMTKVLECIFVKALIWSVGSCVDRKGRQMFGDYLRMVMEDKGLETSDAHQDFLLKNRSWVARDRPIALLPPDDGRLLYDFRFDAKKGQWQPWLETADKFAIPRDATFNSIVVPTMDTVRNEYLIHSLVVHGHHVLCTGDTGTGKSVTAKKKLLFGMGPKFSSIMLNFSAQTSANQTQDIIDSKLDKRRKGVLGPPLGMTCVIFVDDLNMPAKETYGAQPPIEILRQWMDHGGWYDRKENTFRQLVDVQFVAAMGPPGGGRTSITQRYVRHFNLLNFVPFSNESLQRVFGSILEWFLQRGFNSAVKQVAANMVAATLDIYNTIADNLLPTPAKSHYTFNLRDLSKVFQGVLQGSANLISEKEQIVRLWSHECLRIFHDRLVDDSDRAWFNHMLEEKVNAHFGMNYEGRVRGKNEVLLYGNFSDPKGGKVYQEIEDQETLVKTMEDYLEDHNAMTSKPMSLVLFQNAIEHVARISRIICQPMGNALLVGVGGSGRKSLTLLAVSVADYKLFQIEISKSYGMIEWREDLRKVLTMAGAENRATVFLLDDTQLINEAFLEDVNGILNTGEVPSLFNNEEMVAINEALTKPAQAAGINTGSPSEVYAFFIERARTNLHVVLCLSPIGDAFRTRLRMFPSLVNCCTIDWFVAWPQEALKSVARHFLDAVDMEEAVKAGVVDVCVDMQQRARDMAERYRNEMGRFYYVTPTSYLELINTFKNLLHRQRKSVLDRKERYDNGLLKLADTEEQVAQMQIDLEELQPKLKEATIATDALLVQIAKDTEVANEKKAVVEKEAIICNAQAEESRALKASCEADLAEALPALESAVSALKSLSKGDIVEVKAMKKPPAAVKLVMEAVCIMMAVKPDKIKDPNGGTKKIDDYWGPAQKNLLGDSRFLQNLMDYDKDNMDSAMVEKVKTGYTDDSDFDPDKVKKGSVAAAGLCKWVHAMVVYNRVAKVVGPKRAALAEAESTLAQAMADLGEKQAMLKDLMDKLATLQQQLQEAEDKKVALQDQVTDCGNKLRRAEQLISGLGGEKTSWARFSGELQSRYENVTGDITLSSGVIAYMGAFTSSFREQAVSQWARLLGAKNIPCSDNFRLETTLGDAVKIRGWVIDKLPNDSFSIDNAIMLFESNRWPLMIDPQGQANKWVKKREMDNQLKVVKQNQANFVRTIENAIQFGSPILLENVPESLDPVLEPVLLKQVVTVGGISTIRMGDNNVEYDPNFRLYISTKMTNPHYPPELCVKVNLLNFMATQEGLEDQMLGITVAREESELEARREQLVLEDAENKRVQKEIEDTILDLLKNSEGNILDDEVLISTLAQSKVTSNIIERKVKEAAKTQEIIAKTRTGYVPIAFRASQLFFCIADLGTVDPMYQYSLEWFINLFEMAIDKAVKAHVLEDRLKNLSECFTAMLYKNVCRSLFEKHKLLFSFLLSVKIMQGEERMDGGELRFFLQGTTSLDLEEPNPLANGEGWLTDKTWGEIIAAGKLAAMSGFKENFKSNLGVWEGVFVSDDPLAEIEEVVGDAYQPFQKLCLLRAIRPDVVIPGVQKFVAQQEMGASFIEPPPFDLRACYEDSTCSTPLIFVLTPGADPMTELLRVAEELGFGGKKLASISLGQGQGPLAEAAISEAADGGTWVCLQNCHLCISWMPTLERLCQELTPDRVHESFRLWLTSEPSPHFPSFILQNGVKMTNEPPKGMRANLLGSFYNIEHDWFDTCLRSNEFKKMLFGLTFFHATVRERRKFGPLGWNIQYVFSGPDLRISMDQLRIFLDNLRPEDPVPYAALAYLAGECNYGGRVTDDKDRRCLVNILTDFYCAEIQDDNYRFSPSGTYFAPAVGSKDEFVEYIKALPYNEGPEVFGLHANANISCALSETNSLLDTALSLQPRSAGGGGKSWDVTLGELAEDILLRMPSLFDVERALLDFPVRYNESMNTVLTQELIRFNTLATIISKSLAEVIKAIKGLVVMSSELEQMGNSMVVGKVPTLWSSAAYPSLMPLGSWVTDLLLRLDFLGSWMKNGIAPTVFWLSGYFFTQAFITGTLQNFARKHKVPIDKAGFDFRVLTPLEMKAADTTKAEDGAFIRGLFIEGARWNVGRHAIDESRPRELFVSMPYMQLLPRMKTDIAEVKGCPELYTGQPGGTSHSYMCPVYKTSVRQGTLSTTGHSTNFVMFITLPLAEEHTQKHWIKRGVAMLTQLDD
ncbi:unnamed protein product [Pylaiella littoralis]